MFFCSFWYQIKAVLWKNWLEKKAHFTGFLAEILLPILFMVLLIGIKQITTKYDSPAIAYFCGQTYPWNYVDVFDYNNLNASMDLAQCLTKPTDCDTANYYREKDSIYLSGQEFTAYQEYGWVKTPASNGKTYYPFYGFTVADESRAMNEGFENPSLPYCTMIERIHSNNAIFVVAPKNADSPALTQASLDLLNHLNSSCVGNYSNTFHFFEDQAALESYTKDKNYDEVDYKYGKVAFAVVLNNADVAAAQWDYAIRVNWTISLDQEDPTVACLYNDCRFTYTVPETAAYGQFDFSKPPLSDYMFGYSHSGFLTLQQKVDKYIFSFYNNNADTKIMASMGLMPQSDFKSDDFQIVISSVLGIFYMLSYLYPVSRLIRALVIEKEFRIKEGMKMMGLTDTVYNLSWLITTFFQFTLISILITLVTSGTVFEYSNPIYIFIYFESFSIAIVMMCFLMATFFSRSKTASLLGPMIFFATFFPYYAVSDEKYDQGSKVAVCILAPSCFALGANVIADFEGDLIGIQPGNVNQDTSNFNYNIMIGMLWADVVIYGVLAWYLDKVFPSEFGTALPFYFPILPSYWCGVRLTHNKHDKSASHSPFFLNLAGLFENSGYRRVTPRKNQNEAGEIVPSGEKSDVELTDPKHHMSSFEEVPPDLKQQIQEEKCITIRGLRKVFKSQSGGDDKVAVKNLDMEMFQNQCTVLLGHNGAGKTTTISMLVGMINPSDGYALMPGGLDINTDMAAIRRNLGVCPQHDILFPDLTALQHLEIFAAFKGVSSWNVREEAMKMLAEVGLKEKANAKSSTLSGGQKRKLSLGIALIGDSKVVILDEPTSGMDPYSRRSTWNIIQKHKRGRVILLTTHFLDEADKLGDRVAIMAHGKLMCCGSPLFLKNRFGVGYSLTIVKVPQEKTVSTKVHDASTKITELICSLIPSAELLSDVGAEQSFRLPFSASGSFVDLFDSLDENKESIGIAEYGISVTTLEEVFLRVAEIEEEEMHEVLHNVERRKSSSAIDHLPVKQDGEKQVQMVDLSKNNKNDIAPESNDSPSSRDKFVSIEEKDPFFKHFVALTIKRAIYAKRDTRAIICQLVLPVILIVIGLSVLLLQPNFNQPSLKLNSANFNPGFSVAKRNFVPFQITDPDCATCKYMESRFNGNPDDGIDATAVSIVVPETDTFQNCAVGAAPLYNMSQYLINPPSSDEKDQDGSSVFGAITLAEANETTLVYNILVNASSIHSPGIYVNEVHQTYLQAISNIPTAQIVARNYPLPETYKQANQGATINAFVVALFWMIAFCFIPASFAIFVVKEREVKAKHQQVISGVSIYAYWCSTYVWDVLSYLPTAAVVIGILHAYGIDAYTKGPAAGAVVGLILLYGPATAGITYVVSFLFSSHSTAQIIIMFFNFITGLGLMVVGFVLTTLPRTAERSVTIRYIFRIFPSFCLGDGILQLALCVDGRYCPTINSQGYDGMTTQGPLAWDMAGADLLFLGVETVLYFAVAIAIEYGLTFPSLMAWLYRIEDPGITPSELAEDDEDVAEERARVESGQADKDVVKIDSLRKLYPVNSSSGGLSCSSLFCTPKKKDIKVAVQSLSFGIPKGQCFGFLGINGAGKTTTLSILSGEFPPTSGSAFVEGYSIALDQSKIRRKIGYCPQFDALLELLTVREHLELYGRIKGFHGALLEEIVSGKLDQLNLREFEDKVAGSLSGGNKRKLSVAVATIGEPPIVFLDEPSTGMDPKARRFMWKVIARMSTQDARCSVILTTHSMEEAEALCTRIGIMVNGRLRCLGSTQHLKHRFGNGFEVNFKSLIPSEEDMTALLKSLQQKVQGLTAVPGSAAADVDELDAVRIHKNQFEAIANHLGNPSRAAEITQFGSGALIFDAIAAEDSVTARLFLSWWISEDYFERLRQFMAVEFGDRAMLLERSSGQSCRYRIRKAEESDRVTPVRGKAQNPLSEIFARIEAKKAHLHVQEYSVGQTTLEQIFNQFAGHTDNPEVAMLNNTANGNVALTVTPAPGAGGKQVEHSSGNDAPEIAMV